MQVQEGSNECWIRGRERLGGGGGKAEHGQARDTAQKLSPKGAGERKKGWDAWNM